MWLYYICYTTFLCVKWDTSCVCALHLCQCDKWSVDSTNTSLCVWTRTSGTIQQLSGVCLCLLVCVYMSMRGLLNVCNSVCRQEFNSSNDGCECVCKLLSFLSLSGLMCVFVCRCVCVCVCSHLSSGSCLWAGVEGSGWSARCCRAGGTSVDASRETAAPPKLCWTVDETQRCNINIEDNFFFFKFPTFSREASRKLWGPFSNKSSAQPYYCTSSKYFKVKTQFISFLCTLLIYLVFCRVNLQVQKLW